MRHKEKHFIVNQALQGQGSFLYPLINKDHKEAFVLTLEQTNVRLGRNGSDKDKSGDKLAGSEEDKLEFRTDDTDAWDTLFIGMNKFPQASSSICGLVSYFGSFKEQK